MSVFLGEMIAANSRRKQCDLIAVLSVKWGYQSGWGGMSGKNQQRGRSADVEKRRTAVRRYADQRHPRAREPRKISRCPRVAPRARTSARSCHSAGLTPDTGATPKFPKFPPRIAPDLNLNLKVP